MVARARNSHWEFGHDVHGLAAIGDYPVHARVVAEMQAGRVHALEGLYHRGKRTRAIPWGRRGMCGAAISFKPDLSTLADVTQARSCY